MIKNHCYIQNISRCICHILCNYNDQKDTLFINLNLLYLFFILPMCINVTCAIHVKNFLFLQRAGKWNNLLIKSINVARYTSFVSFGELFLISFWKNIRIVIVAAILSTLLSDKKGYCCIDLNDLEKKFLFLQKQ